MAEPRKRIGAMMAGLDIRYDLGDASIDPRNYLGMGAYDLVPTKLVATTGLKTASDDWFGVPNDETRQLDLAQ